MHVEDLRKFLLIETMKILLDSFVSISNCSNESINDSVILFSTKLNILANLKLYFLELFQLIINSNYNQYHISTV